MFVELVYASDSHLPEIIVSAPRFETSLRDAGQHIDVIEAQDIRMLGARSIDEILSILSTIDVMQRGPFGVQSDIRLRGASFEQTLFLLNGLKINDPQSGHFHSDLPVSIGDIERVEVMPVGASALYGTGGFGGVINIVTKKKEKPNVTGGYTIGGKGYYELKASLKSPVIRDTQLGIALSDQKSNGYSQNTDFHNTLYNASLITDVVNLYGGLSEKRFGAKGFYSLKYPMQWEHTRSGFMSGALDIKAGELSFKPGFLYRHHYDYYVLDRNNQSFYNNIHRTNVFNLSLPLSFSAGDLGIVSGYDMSYENIDSSRLGRHRRLSQGIFTGFKTDLKGCNANINLRLDNYSGGIGSEFSPSASLSYNISEAIRLRFAGGRSFRLPSYTELYYTSPVHISNPALKPERAWQAEGGMDLYGNAFVGGITLFKRWGRDIIDWLDRGGFWQSENIKDVDTSGITAQVTYYVGRHRMKIDYTFLSQRDSAGMPAYYLNYLRHKLNVLLISEISDNFRASIVLSLQNRIDNGSYGLVDFKLTKGIQRLPLEVNVFMEARNLTNTHYQSISGRPMPGRWLFAGIEIGTPYRKEEGI